MSPDYKPRSFSIHSLSGWMAGQANGAAEKAAASGWNLENNPCRRDQIEKSKAEDQAAKNGNERNFIKVSLFKRNKDYKPQFSGRK
mmetsp:Transcript_21905/g.25194  ORF Transcript_21905/g.25194 Transcript_21905/m.25194 type:complete len:86 (+) Transcript_21905:1396-1653(+)